MRQVLNEGLAQRFFVETRDQPFTGDGQRPLDYPRFLGHQLDCLRAAKLARVKPVALKSGLFGLRKSRGSCPAKISRNSSAVSAVLA